MTSFTPFFLTLFPYTLYGLSNHGALSSDCFYIFYPIYISINCDCHKLDYGQGMGSQTQHAWTVDGPTACSDNNNNYYNYLLPNRYKNWIKKERKAYADEAAFPQLPHYLLNLVYLISEVTTQN